MAPEALASTDFVLLCGYRPGLPPAGGSAGGSHAVYQDRELAPDQRYYYRVAAYDQDGYLGGWSQTLSHAWGWLPRAPQGSKPCPGTGSCTFLAAGDALQDGPPARDLAGYRSTAAPGRGPGSA